MGKHHELPRRGIKDVVITLTPDLAEATAQEQPIARLRDLQTRRVGDEIEALERTPRKGIGAQRQELVLRGGPPEEDAGDFGVGVEASVAAREVGAGDNREPLLRDALEPDEGLGGHEQENLGDQILVTRDDLRGRIALQLHFKKSSNACTERERESLSCERREGETLKEHSLGKTQKGTSRWRKNSPSPEFGGGVHCRVWREHRGWRRPGG